MESKYIRKYVKDRIIDEHRYVMEQYLGRKLERFEFVHHMNGDKKDNRIENLVIMNGHEHAIIHNQIYPVYKTCVVCGKKYTPNKTKRNRSKTCSNECKIKLDIKNASARKRAIDQFDLNDVFIKRWNSGSEIEIELNIFYSNICKCCKNTIKSAYGYKWKFAEILKGLIEVQNA